MVSSYDLWNGVPTACRARAALVLLVGLLILQVLWLPDVRGCPLPCARQPYRALRPAPRAVSCPLALGAPASTKARRLFSAAAITPGRAWSRNPQLVPRPSSGAFTAC